MRAVNLLPRDLRTARREPRRSVRPEPVQGIGAQILLGALALCVAAVAGFVLVNNDIKQRESDLEVAQQRASAATAKAAALKPYADFEALASARVETVRGLAASRFDWEQALRDISRAIPGDVKLQSLEGDMGLPGAPGGGDALRGSIQAPAISLGGCASSQSSVARLMARIKAVDGATRVSLSKTESTAANGSVASTSESPCGTDDPPTFSIVVFFEGSAASAALAPAEVQGVPVPKAVDQANGAADEAEGDAAAADSGAAADPQAGATESSAADPSTSTTTSTTNSTGGTP
jgi:Tfp pilus assembly protein PilN